MLFNNVESVHGRGLRFLWQQVEPVIEQDTICLAYLSDASSDSMLLMCMMTWLCGVPKSIAAFWYIACLPQSSLFLCFHFKDCS